MPDSASDPRVFFAAERTLLAWLRTGFTVVAIGFMIARFGLFLRLLAWQHPQAAHHGLGVSAVLGILFVALGTAAMGFATWQHRRFVATLGPAERPTVYAGGFALLFGGGMALLGILLVAYLALTSVG